MLPMIIECIEGAERNQPEINVCYDNIVNLMLDEADSSMKAITKKRKNMKYKPYWDAALSNKWKIMQLSEKKYRKICKEKVNVNVRSFHQRLFKHNQRLFDKMLKNKKREYLRNMSIKLDKLNMRNPREFWQYVKRLGPQKRYSIPWEVDIDGIKYTNHKVVLEKWKNDFEKIYKADCTGFDNDYRDVTCRMLETKLKEDKMNYDVTNVCNSPITLQEVQTAVNQAKNNKAAGCDGTANELIKHETVISLLVTLYNLCLQHCIIPDMWRDTIIHPIPKERGRSIDPMKYRGIALQNCISKILSNIINNRVVNILDDGHVLEDTQNGFRRHRSCVHQIFNLVTLVDNKCIKKNGNIFGCFVDFCKAFDYVNRSMMYAALRNCGVQGKTLELIKEMYSNTNNVVRLNDEYSDSFVSEMG